MRDAKAKTAKPNQAMGASEASSAAMRGAGLLEIIASIIVIGFGIALFFKVQGRTSKDSGTNSKLLVAGKMVEKHLEDTRLAIFSDTVKNWPPKDTAIASAAPNYISLKRTVTNALSPKDGAIVANVKCVSIKATWTSPKTDSVVITTYVSKRF